MGGNFSLVAGSYGGEDEAELRVPASHVDKPLDSLQATDASQLLLAVGSGRLWIHAVPQCTPLSQSCCNEMQNLEPSLCQCPDYSLQQSKGRKGEKYEDREWQQDYKPGQESYHLDNEQYSRMPWNGNWMQVTRNR